MNCEEFETIVNDRTRTELVDTDARQPYLVHARACSFCADRLADQRELAAGLQALAADSAEKEASPHVEAALLAAFRQQFASPISATAVKTPVKTNVVAFPVKRRPIQLWALAAAAALLIACAIGASLLLKNASSEKPTITFRPSPAALPAMPKQQNVAGAEIADPDEKKPGKPRKKPLPRRPFADRSSVIASIGEFTPVGFQESKQEVTTEFLPLTQGFDSEPLESGQLIRVQMPRTALASFGLPVNLERANVPVKADVLLAEDGSARAIRFVR